MLLDIKKSKFPDKKVLIIGAGWMARHYCHALFELGIRDVSVISWSEKSFIESCEKFGFNLYHGGYETCLPNMGTFDLVIIATPIDKLVPAAMAAITHGNLNVLVEKPGALCVDDLNRLKHTAKDRGCRVRVAYNRLTYPSYWKLIELVEKEGGITSCKYTFTELIESMDFGKHSKNTYERWGIANSLHVISMAHSLIGMPEELFDYRQGGFSWHPSGSQFAGAGITEKGIMFSYHADWESAGRWGIEIMTPENAYRMIPIEKLMRCKKGTFTWESVSFEAPFSGLKEGIAEEVAVMLEPSLEEALPLVSLDKAGDFIKLAERIFGYYEKKQ